MNKERRYISTKLFVGFIAVTVLFLVFSSCFSGAKLSEFDTAYAETVDNVQSHIRNYEDGSVKTLDIYPTAHDNLICTEVGSTDIPAYVEYPEIGKSRTYLRMNANEKNQNTSENGHQVSGDFYSYGGFGNSEKSITYYQRKGQTRTSYVSVEGVGRNDLDNGFCYGTNNDGSCPTTYWYSDWAIGDNLKAALADPFVNVNISLWILDDVIKNGSGGSKISCQVKFSIFSDVGNGVSEYAVGTNAPHGFYNFGTGEASSSDYLNLTNDLTGIKDLGDNAFFRVSMYDWSGSNSGFAWSAFYVDVTVTKATSINVLPESVIVYDPSERRIAQTLYTENDWSVYGDFSLFPILVKPGDVIIIQSKIKRDGTELKPSKNANDANADGYFYMQMYQPEKLSKTFLHYATGRGNTVESERIYQYSFPKEFADNNFYANGVKRLGFEFTTSNGVSTLNLNGDASGMVAMFQLSKASSSDKTFSITSSMWESSGPNILTGESFAANFDYDAVNPVAPTVERNSADGRFYNKYLSNNRVFYTDTDSYQGQNISVGGISEYTITGVDLGKGSLIPKFSQSALLNYESDLYIYCKATRVASIPRNGERSVLFDYSEATLYCTVSPYNEVTYGSILLDLFDTGSGKYAQNGFYSLEFLAVDNAGNFTMNDMKMYMKVDVADYVFDCNLVLGQGATGEFINMSEVELAFATIKDDNSLSAYRIYNSLDKISFKRGEKVLIRVRVVDGNKYIFTAFDAGNSREEVTSANIKQTNSTYSIEAWHDQTSGNYYSFEITSDYDSDGSEGSFAGGELTFKFKMRATIVVINTEQTFNGGGLKVIPSVKDSFGATIPGNVKTFYTINGEEMETLPVNAGQYPFRCILENHTTYYATYEGVFTIRTARPVINPDNILIEDINYGDSLANLDYREITDAEIEEGMVQDFNTRIKIVLGSDFHSDRSADGIIGYYMLDIEDKTTLNYVRHDAGTMSVTVTFVPVKSDRGLPVYNDGRFQRDTNYDTVSFTSQITIRHSTEVLITLENSAENGVVIYSYDGLRKDLNFNVISVMSDEYGLNLNNCVEVEYGNADGFSSVAPIDAGDYKVRVTLKGSSRNKCNYSGSWEYDMRINKRQLTVAADDSYFDFQYEQKPTPIATYKAGSLEEKYYSLSYTFEYYYYNGKGFEETAVEENAVPADKISSWTNAPFNAGTYLVKMTLNENNFENSEDGYCLLTVNTVTSNSPRFTANSVQMPTLTAPDGVNLYYMQPLFMADKCLEINSTTAINYFYRDGSRYVSKQVEGYYMLAYRDFAKGETVEKYVEDNRNHVYEHAGTFSGYICFIATGDDEGNFDPILREADIVVGLAQPDWTSITLKNITYLTEVNSIEDLFPTGNLRFKLFDSEEITEENYKYVTAEDEEYGYTLELVKSDDYSPLYSAGYKDITVKITPTGTQKDNIEEINATFTIFVNKYELNINLNATETESGYPAFIYNYGKVAEPKPTFTDEENKTVNVQYSISYTDFDTGVEVTSDALDVGIYLALLTINDSNYSGEAEYLLKVNKGNLQCRTLPEIYEIETVVAYNRLMSDVVFHSGIMQAEFNGTVVTVSGSFFFDVAEGERFTATGERLEYKLRFVPDDANYNEYVADSFCLELTVAKENVSSGIELSVIDDKEYEYGTLRGGEFNVEDIIGYTTNVWKNGSDYAYEETAGYEYLKGNFRIANLPLSGALPAGDYPITFTIDDENYAGSKTIVLTVKKKQAEIFVADEDRTVDFNNMSRTVNYVVRTEREGGYEEINETVSQIFYSDGVEIVSPSFIGKYGVTLSLHSNNYYADDLSFDFVIRVDKKLISVSNTDQVYSAPRQVSATIRLIDCRYSIQFVDKKSDDINADLNNSTVNLYNSLPINAGEYWIRLLFSAEDNNGYEDIIVYDKPLVIEKYVVTINVSDRITVSYTGASAVNTFRITTNPANIKYKIEYRKEGTDEFTEREVLDANTAGNYHTVRIRINPDELNYTGEKTILYRINPATLTAEETPIFGNYTYNSSTAPSVSADGLMTFRGATVQGKYYINIEDINSLSVGLHSVKYYFVALKSSDETPNGNFSVYEGTTELNIVKSEITADNIVIGQGIGTSVEYNGTAFTVDVYVKSEAIFDPITNSDITIKVYYNGQTERPKEPGEYTVRVEIASRNYFGSAVWEHEFNVTKGTPIISVLPVPIDGKVFHIGDTFALTDLKEGSGAAVVKDTQKAVRGEFIPQEKTFPKANLNDLSVTFVPYDTDHFNSVSFNIKVNVSGVAPLRTDIDGDWNGAITLLYESEEGIAEKGTFKIVAEYDGIAKYGVKAGDFHIRVESDDTELLNYINAFGMFYVSDDNFVPNVGGEIEVKFSPLGYHADKYDIMSGRLAVNIEKAELNGELEFIPYEGGTFGESEVILKVDGKVVSLSGNLLLYDGDTLVFDKQNGIGADASPEKNSYTFEYVFDNFQTLSGTLEINAKKKIEEANILVAKTTKSYDGKIISVSDLGIRIINTETIITDDDCEVRVYLNGEETELCEPATYAVVIRISNGSFYGEKTVEYTITKRNVSADMELDSYVSVYGSNFVPQLYIDGEKWSDKYTIVYKSYGASDALYNGNMPDNAGRYTVKVTVDAETCSGEAVFDFTIEPKRIVMVADAQYSYDFGKTAPPKISFRELNSVTPVTVDYGIYYYSDVMSMGERNVLPVNAGKYTARVIPDDDNYSFGENGYDEFSYIINKLSLSIATYPTVFGYLDGEDYYNLKYGQTLGELSVSGGTAKYRDETVNGIFVVTEPSGIPEAGKQAISVEFIPEDGNYSSVTGSMEISVAPADATVLFDTLQMAYTGSSLKNAVTYSVIPSIPVRVEFYDAYGHLTDPVSAGGYTVNVVSLDKNYKVTSARGLDGGSPVFIVAKASVRDYSDPRANSISVGDNLNKSSLTSGEGYGKVYYYGFNNPVAGKFDFVESALTFKNAGTYTVAYTFVPNDSQNFAIFQGTTTITVGRALASVQVSNTSFVYSEGFTNPVFRTNPEGLRVMTDITFNEYDPTSPSYIYNERDFVDVGTYYFSAWIDDADYYSEKVEFAVTITKKNIDIDFVTVNDGISSVIMQYLTTYGKPLEAKIKLYPDGTAGKRGYLLKDEVVDGMRIDEGYEVRYSSAEQDRVYDSFSPPSAMGVYTVTVTLRNKNYSATKTAIYKIESGKIESVHFDTETMENQVYGSVVAPIITTVPANISYYIIYQGYETVMPKSAGSYYITVYFNDENYEKMQSSAMFKINPKPITVTDIVAKDKVYDGLSAIEVEGQLSGIVYEDEVELRMKASTVNGDVSVGSHYIDIHTYSLVGLQSSNYTLAQPVYHGQVNITSAKINAKNNSSFITSAIGFADGTTVEFKTINSQQNASTFFEKVTGRDSKIIGYNVKVNGADVIIKDTFKVYMAIPEEYLGLELGKDFEIEGLGGLEEGIVFAREGDYITFYATKAGQVKFKKTEFRYEFVVIVAAIVMAVIGIIVLIIINPMQKRKNVTDTTREKEAIKRIKIGY